MDYTILSTLWLFKILSEKENQKLFILDHTLSCYDILIILYLSSYTKHIVEKKYV